jgi:hypothetical protein
MAEAEETKVTLPCEVNQPRQFRYSYFDRAAFNAQETVENAYKLAPKL